MALNPSETREMALYLDHGILEAKELPRITEKFPALSLEDAYRIQDSGIELRVARGEKVVGYKMGLTSKAKQEQMNLRSPIYGVLTDRMEVRSGKFSMRGKIHPKIEPEIVFWISKDLSGDVSAEQVLNSCSAVGAALEILDSRFVGFKYFSLPDVVADNCSSAFYVLGKQEKVLKNSDFTELDMVMSIDGKPVQKAKSSAILDNPVNSVIALVKMLDDRGQKLKAGNFVLAGAATVAEPLKSGAEVSLQISGFQNLKVQITE